MSQKHLHELLKEDQEPFLLTNYISNKRNQLKRQSPNTTLQLKKQKPTTTTTINLCKNACFLSFQNTPDIKKSPIFELNSPVKKSPRGSSNAIFLQIPAKTASLLLEASLRIQNKKPHCKNKPFRLGSFFKKLTQRNRNKKSESIEAKKEVGSCEVGYRCSSWNGRTSSAVWSESNEDKSLDMETSCSGHSCDYVEEVQFVMNKDKENGDCACFHHRRFFCESPFRFVLQRSASSSSARRTPDFPSPVGSPTHNQTEDKENNGGDEVNKFQSGEDEEEKEQCSPVSILDPPFEDYDDDCHENDDQEGGFDLECSYANVQRTKQQLLDRLRRFEQLAELDPLQLEKRMHDEEDIDYETFFEKYDVEEDDSEAPCSEEKSMKEIVCEILSRSRVHDKWHDPKVLKKLVYDLIKEEEKALTFSHDMNMVMKRVCKKLELWKEVESNTIDMMIEDDFSREENGWKKNDVETKELACELEVAIFCFLVDEFSEELVC